MGQTTAYVGPLTEGSPVDYYAEDALIRYASNKVYSIFPDASGNPKSSASQTESSVVWKLESRPYINVDTGLAYL